MCSFTRILRPFWTRQRSKYTQYLNKTFGEVTSYRYRFAAKYSSNCDFYAVDTHAEPKTMVELNFADF